jgi:hypothetical protein
MLYLEVSESQWRQIKKLADKFDLKYKISDCTISGDKERMIHIDFLDKVPVEQIDAINNLLDEIIANEPSDKFGYERPGVSSADVTFTMTEQREHELERAGLLEDYDGDTYQETQEITGTRSRRARPWEEEQENSNEETTGNMPRERM